MDLSVAVTNNAPSLVAEHQWRSASTAEEAVTALKHADIVEHTPNKRSPQINKLAASWNRTTAPERRMVVVVVVEEIAKQREWTWWESVESMTISWKDLWHMEAKQLSFVRATYDILPTLSSLPQWLGEEPGCACCTRPAVPSQSLRASPPPWKTNEPSASAYEQKYLIKLAAESILADHCWLWIKLPLGVNSYLEPWSTTLRLKYLSSPSGSVVQRFRGTR